MKTHEELTREFYQTLEESDRKHAEHISRLSAKKREIFALLGGKKPSENGKNDK